MTINQINPKGEISVDSKEEIVSGASNDLKDNFTIVDLRSQFAKLTPEIVKVRELRDDKRYNIGDILGDMFDETQKGGYTDIKVTECKEDETGTHNIVAIHLEGKSEKYGGCFVRLSFVRNCSYGENSGSDETCIIEEYYDDDTFAYPFDAEVIRSY